MDEVKTTGTLTSILRAAKPEDISKYLQDNEASLVCEDRPFAYYMRSTLREKGLRQQDVFLAADIPEGYGYKLVSEEKRTRQRDVIVRLCLAGHFSLEEAQKALKLYQMATLYAKVPRDAVLIIALNKEIYSVDDVNELLAKNHMDPLRGCGASE